jgi:hypothetical protein
LKAGGQVKLHSSEASHQKCLGSRIEVKPFATYNSKLVPVTYFFMFSIQGFTTAYAPDVAFTEPAYINGNCLAVL